MGVFDKFVGTEKETEVQVYNDNTYEVQEGIVSENKDDLQRRLGNREIQLLAIGGSIGTALFVSIGSGLHHAGPAGLSLAYTIYSCMLGLINNCISEMTILMPVWWFYSSRGSLALLIPFEITALCTVLGFWRDDIPAGAVIAVAIVLYAALNILAVKAYGEAEFWLSGGKVILIFLLFSFTFVTMCGGNPQGDAYGFRYWNHPGPFAEYLSTGDLGRFEGFLAGLWSASFCVVGPEYISMVAAEAKRPRIYIKNAFKTVYWRFGLFFILGSLCVGVLIPYNDPTLTAILSGDSTGSGTASASPYVIAMKNLGVSGLPHLVNALLVTSRAPKFLRYCTKQGVPLACFCVVMCFPCLAFLQLGSGSEKVLTWLVNLITAGGIINYVVMATTYIFFYNACKAEGLDRRTLPYRGWFQPYSAYIGLAWMLIMVFCYGYSSFKPWSVDSFFTFYTMLILAPVLFVGWKLIKRTKFVKASEADLVWERPLVDAYEETFIDPPVGFWKEMIQVVGIGRKKGGNDRRRSSVAA
ncbi:hypothetical protein M409DRAFT_62803 [Zasmidium cellare ATCC 36951]|uniref:Amino acid permease/ SLC12A domain-containing protein n=1 Tax=Zasmidium cellare ATCC 36951 TaxID=1080233 RepID=A0A6A6D1D0_ZASCE|nr:uncharacterized protein M409DRAFT_62803 [Zasmidium cellare ATCC 36951]KAF2173234.1 hypothetical protein M409DRAFT_62803 [Zasmidium cellare ATCC 36951]